MKEIRQKLIPLLTKGFCVPQIARIAKETKEPSTTIHYNLRRLEQTKAVRAYKAVFDYSQIDMGFCSFVMLKLSPDNYGDPEKVGRRIAKFEQIESVDIVTGDFEMILKVRVKDQDAFYTFIKQIGSIPGVTKTFTLVSFKQLKTEFVVTD